MMANSWKTVDQICSDYDIEKKTFYKWADECKSYPQYQDAIIQPTNRRTYIVENRWQDFLCHLSELHRQKALDPHIRKKRR